MSARPDGLPVGLLQDDHVSFACRVGRATDTLPPGGTGEDHANRGR